jgi:uncharacterized membrane protein
MKKNLFSLLALLLIVAAPHRDARAQTAQVHARVDAARIVIGDQVRYFIEASVDTTKAQLRWASVPDTFNHLEVGEKGKIDTSRQGALVTYKQRLLITGFDSGSFAIPAFTFVSVGRDGKADTLRTDTTYVLVQTVAVDTTKAFKDIKGIVAVSVGWRYYIWYIVGGLVLLIALVVIIVSILNRKRAVKVPETVERVETDQERALRLLDELAAKELWQQDRIKEYYTELTDIVRMYIEARFRMPAMELTTGELLKQSRKNKDLVPFVKSLSQILNTADLAKFAKANPAPEEHIEAIEMAKNFIVISKPKADPLQPKTGQAS